MTHENIIRLELATLPRPVHVAFAAACAERVSGVYSAECNVAHRDPAMLPPLADVGRVVTGDIVPDETSLRALMVRLEENAFPSEPDAQAAAMTILSAILSAAGDRDAAFAAADCAVNLLISNVCEALDIKPDDPRYEDEACVHPLVLAECSRQQIDLRDLRDGVNPAVIRDRAKVERVTLLPIPPRAKKSFINPFTRKEMPRG